ncbi:LysM peptidoglycan-binding domain-containing protein [Aerococcus urinae]|uniref:Peptidoglycan hydrolase n=1 Tax=Aerococcus urinae TaxID=1376 RepID=A0A0X8FDY4_9LACT|nr:LysM peptidoglycan-binding domain-containing protein [Aerococcus urinae]AMB95460.1 hypothetical protein AWM73_02490 [Aerococcus urinae]MCY3032683.1 LysM peptidoglycan-binding domain-containing protein [Aerococcus urinae]MCY3044729.1 LysM peptidoglycan-binding domain-containing protein [Aerococcus urinae]MCY3045865.1 LysM peptidoglycan-binding domain-containing protein [Aerococcus urinae]MCY3048184.1 LysM peptidoglycan-binding domain-containing protein [Aerococcus urinae]
MTGHQEKSKKLIKTSAVLLSSVVAIAGADALANYTPVQATTLAPTSNNFLNKILPYAYDLANQNDLYASVMMAQAALESGWGSSRLSQAPYNNLFGIKGNYKGKTANFNTLEDDGRGNYYQINDGFRMYPSYRESLIDYVGVLKNGTSWNPNFYSGAWKSKTNSYKDATAWLTGRYATDTSYGSKLNSIIAKNNLSQYDTPGKTISNNQRNSSQVSTPTAQPGGRSYVVKPGDGLWTVARQLGTSIEAVKQANGLSSNLIYPGQVLYAGASSSSPAKANTSSPVRTSSPAAKPAQSAKQSYRVQAGDGLWTVAKNLGTTIEAVKAANGLTSNFIYPGQVLYAPGQKQNSASPAGTTTNQQSQGQSHAGYKSYTVQAGDGLWTVARHLGMTVDTLKAKYGLTSNFIYPGQVFTNQTSQGSHKPSNNSPAANNPRPSHNGSQAGVYQVQAGDTLYRIARNQGLTVNQLKEMNGLTSNAIYVGQKLNLAAKAAYQPTAKSGVSASQEITAPTPSQRPASPKPVSQVQAANTYQIKAGDNLYRIALNHGVSLNQLLAANQLKANSLILPGQQLVIPQ